MKKGSGSNAGTGVAGFDEAASSFSRLSPCVLYPRAASGESALLKPGCSGRDQAGASPRLADASTERC
jgi:hypothetical protein